ncbi:MAG: ABC transporter permease [Selenomonas sp.]|uniref:nickel transporter permease n=1 Tax=Selenomonas sp. TaxID=2053611 RepID=UPI0025CDC968|nr:nickel transporter permease [Selenomonas sp.]MCI6232643.1 ABC transporter permease [Selenomonas sp.]
MKKGLLPYLIAAGVLLLVAVFAPLLTPMDPYAQDLSVALAPPDAVHLLGTDRYGRDLLSRVIAGAQTTLCASLLLLACISVFGSVIGMVCGYYGGRLDTVLMRISDGFLAFPEMVFAIAVAGAMGGGLVSAALALALIGWPKYARVARGLVLTIREAPYIEAARMAGRGTGRILLEHVAPNIAGPILVTAALHVGTIIMELAGLSFLGLGAMPPTAEWGAMMNNGRSMLQTAPWVVLAPGSAIFVAVAVFNLLGDKLRDVLDARSK